MTDQHASLSENRPLLFSRLAAKQQFASAATCSRAGLPLRSTVGATCVQCIMPASASAKSPSQRGTTEPPHRLQVVLSQEAGSGRKLVVATDLVATLAQKLGVELAPLCPSFAG